MLIQAVQWVARRILSLFLWPLQKNGPVCYSLYLDPSILLDDDRFLYNVEILQLPRYAAILQIAGAIYTDTHTCWS